MGYRSDVAYKIKFEDAETMKLFLIEVKCNDEIKDALTDEILTDKLVIDEDKLFIRFEASCVKWYDEYPEVQAHEALLGLAKTYRDDHEKKLEYAFARIGEEMGDIDDYASDEGYHLVYISRQILFDED